MTKPFGFEKPSGVKDYLPEAVIKLKHIENEVLACMHTWGYEQIITPTLEFYDTVGMASSTSDQKLFKLLDKRGTTMVMRSDMTAPIARVIASLLHDRPYPLRLSYHSTVFRAIEEEAGRDSEFFQTGVELVGDASPEADAEVVALAVHCLRAAGVDTFKIAMGHVGFLNGLFEDILPGRDADQTVLKEYLLMKDYVGFQKAVRTLSLAPDQTRELAGIFSLRGGREICERAGEFTRHPTAQKAIAHLCEVLSVLEAYGVGEHVTLDLTMLGNFSYYTGMTFEGYSVDMGFPVLNGGRYDNLLSQFGRSAPATGFALETNRILQMSGIKGEAPYRILIVHDRRHRGEAIRHAMALRKRSGVSVELRMLDTGEPLKQELLPDGEIGIDGRLYRDLIEFRDEKAKGGGK